MNKIVIAALAVMFQVSVARAEVIVFEYNDKTDASLSSQPKAAEPIVFEYKGTNSLAPTQATNLAGVIVFEYHDIDTKGLAQDVLVSSYHEISGKKVVLRQLANGLLGLEIGGKQVLKLLPVCETCK